MIFFKRSIFKKKFLRIFVNEKNEISDFIIRVKNYKNGWLRTPRNMSLPFIANGHIPYVFHFSAHIWSSKNAKMMKKWRKKTPFFHNRRYGRLVHSAAGTLEVFCHLWLFFVTKKWQKTTKSNKATLAWRSQAKKQQSAWLWLRNKNYEWHCCGCFNFCMRKNILVEKVFILLGWNATFLFFVLFFFLKLKWWIWIEKIFQKNKELINRFMKSNLNIEKLFFPHKMYSKIAFLGAQSTAI